MKIRIYIQFIRKKLLQEIYLLFLIVFLFKQTYSLNKMTDYSFRRRNIRRYNHMHYNNIYTKKNIEPNIKLYLNDENLMYKNNMDKNDLMYNNDIIKKNPKNNKNEMLYDELEDIEIIKQKLKLVNKKNNKKKQLTNIIQKNLNKHLDINVLLDKNKTNLQETSFEIIELKLKNLKKDFFEFIKNKNQDQKLLFDKKIKQNDFTNIINNPLKFNKKTFNNILEETVDKKIITNDCEFVMPFIKPIKIETFDLYKFKENQLLKYKPKQKQKISSPPMNSNI